MSITSILGLRYLGFETGNYEMFQFPKCRDIFKSKTYCIFYCCYSMAVIPKHFSAVNHIFLS